MNRTASIAHALAADCLAAAPAEARRKAAPAPATDDADAGAGKSVKGKPDASGKPLQIGTFGDWNAYIAKGKIRTCYALGSPKERKPEAKRGPAYVFIADRPVQKVHNEVSIVTGTPLKDGAPAQAKVGTASFDLVVKGPNAWIKNPDEEAKFVEALRRSPKLVVKAAPARGPAITDTYVLAGLKQALDRVTKECK
jgi:hypothetical protein